MPVRKYKENENDINHPLKTTKVTRNRPSVLDQAVASRKQLPLFTLQSDKIRLSLKSAPLPSRRPL